ncbi:Do family serine endopeptidase [Marivirga sp. S37H4]|uniref:Do family serine endopeptidase n=1 Tax=Marivirga aurantiaca TaxID=2802615 RepID=A0A934WZG9_9BACT|nr:Do family serine endopeptidase [Marivirga aurantiaca]MBK6265746.1 Do family serine endopeptidase [Marivirga aurantiaca]
MLSKKQFFLGVLIASFLSALIAIGGFMYLNSSSQENQTFEEIQESNAKLSSFLDETEYSVPEGINFIYAAEQVTKGVVHIRAEITRSQPRSRSPFEEYFRDFYGDQGGRQFERKAQSSGSGVIISPDGYIVTNNHVVENASKLEVILYDNRSYTADVIGIDPNTDLALLKIDARDLQFVEFGNSDHTKVGEWVLAVGNPFNLTSTVTAGIVSAKSRNINILNAQNQYGIESFIQTDAAVNPGNSGGALVNLKGKLIGINTAIATPTGSYAGYSFAVPATLVSKVVNDLKEYGVVQRAMLGVSILNLNDPRLESEDIDLTAGVYIAQVGPESAADKAGLKQGDIITSIGEYNISTVSELQEYVARNSPGDKIEVTYVRNGKKNNVEVTLQNVENTLAEIKPDVTTKIEGAVIEDISEEEKDQLNIDGGVKITEVGDGKWKEIGVKEGFVITAIDKVTVQNTEELSRILQSKRGGILIEGVYPDGTKAYYGMGW